MKFLCLVKILTIHMWFFFMTGFRRTWKYDPFLPNSGSFLKIRENSDNNFRATNFLIFDFETSSQWILLCPKQDFKLPTVKRVRVDNQYWKYWKSTGKIFYTGKLLDFCLSYWHTELWKNHHQNKLKIL